MASIPTPQELGEATRPENPAGIPRAATEGRKGGLKGIHASESLFIAIA